jgi:hypothetical protein
VQNQRANPASPAKGMVCCQPTRPMVQEIASVQLTMRPGQPSTGHRIAAIARARPANSTRLGSNSSANSTARTLTKLMRCQRGRVCRCQRRSWSGPRPVAGGPAGGHPGSVSRPPAWPAGNQSVSAGMELFSLAVTGHVGRLCPSYPTRATPGRRQVRTSIGALWIRVGEEQGSMAVPVRGREPGRRRSLGSAPSRRELGGPAAHRPGRPARRWRGRPGWDRPGSLVDPGTKCGDHPHLPPTNPLPLPPAGGCSPHFMPGRSSQNGSDQPLVGAGKPPGMRRPAARWLRVVVAVVVQAGTGSQADRGQLLQGQAGHVPVTADPPSGLAHGDLLGVGQHLEQATADRG